MPLIESQILRGSESIKLLPSSNIRFRLTEDLNPELQKKMQSKESMENLQTLIEEINQILDPRLKYIYEDLQKAANLKEDNIQKFSLNAVSKKQIALVKLTNLFEKNSLRQKSFSFYDKISRPKLEERLKESISQRINERVKNDEKPIIKEEEETFNMQKIFDKIHEKAYLVQEKGEILLYEMKIQNLEKENEVLKEKVSILNVYNQKNEPSLVQKSKSSFDLVKKIKFLASVYKGIMQKRLYYSFENMKNQKLSRSKRILSIYYLLGKQKSEKNKLLKAFFGWKRQKKSLSPKELKRSFASLNEKLLKTLRESFYNIRGCFLTSKLHDEQITNKLKGKILLSVFKERKPLTLRNLFIRWKVRSDYHLAKKTIDRYYK